jgi:hypothetical protein
MTEDHIGIRLDGVIYVKLDHVKPMRDRIEKLEAAMRSIAANACCDSCREAALVARKALEGEDD